MKEVLILGGGLAGSSAAILLARAGKSVTVLEREKVARNKMCGEFLSIEAQDHLRLLGMNCAALGAVPINRVRVVAGARAVEARLPFVALGLSRERLDEALLAKSIEAGAQVERGVRVSGIAGHDVSTNAGGRTADTILLATGKHDVRGGTAPGSVRSDYVAYKMHWKLPSVQRDAINGVIELILFEGGYAGLQPVSADSANLCLVVRRQTLASTGNQWADVLHHILKEPLLRERLGDGQPQFESPITAANLAYGHVCGSLPESADHVFRLGDQGAMTASLTGDGMAIALRSASLASDSILAGRSAGVYHARLRREVETQVKRAMLLQRVTQSPILTSLGLRTLRIWPQLLGSLARLTRIPDYQGRHVW